MALRELPPVSDLLDIGTHDGTMLRLTKARGIGIDPELAGAPALAGVTFIKGFFPVDLPALPDGTFGAATALAVAEHVPETELATWAKVLAQLMAPRAVLVLTVPAPAVDLLLHILIRLRLISGPKPTSTTDSSPPTWTPSSPPHSGGAASTAASSSA